MVKDRLDYNQRIGQEGDEEMLGNIVRLRYARSPVLLTTTQIIAGYGHSRNVAGNISGVPMTATAPSFGANGGASWSDNPTITYQPLSGKGFSKNILSPIPPDSLVPLINSGLPIDTLLQLTVQSIGNAHNTSGTIPGRTGHQESTNFVMLQHGLRQLQQANLLILESQTDSKNNTHIWLLFPDVKYYSSVNETIRNIRYSLGLDENASKAEIVYGHYAQKGQIPIITRSMLGIWEDISSTMEVPQSAVKNHTTSPTIVRSDISPRPPIIIHYSYDQPKDAYVSSEFEHVWYWIGNGDLASKEAFSILQFLAALAENGTHNGAVVTIPTGR